MTNSAKSTLSSGSKQPSTGHGGATNISFDQLSAAPSSATTSFKRPGSSGKRSAKSYGKLERSFSMTPIFTIAESSAAFANDGAPSNDPIARSESIAVHHRLPIGEHLVTELRRPSMWPEEFKDKDPEYDPDEEARRFRRQIEAALRMYPRNTWGPTTKWGFWEEVPGNGDLKQKCHFKDQGISNHDELEKERISKRDVGFVRNWTKYKNLPFQWENNEEAKKSLGFCEVKDQYLQNSEKLLHSQNDERLAKVKRNDARRRSIKNTREFTRLERREIEYLDRINNEALLRKNPGSRKIKSSVTYNILAPNHRTGEDGFATKLKNWRACMRSLRLQSKQSGARMYNVMTWKPQKPCCVPPPKPEPPTESEETVEERRQLMERKSSPARPRNMLHSMDRVDYVPVRDSPDETLKAA